MLRWFKIREHERGLLFRDRVFRGVLKPGRHFVFDPLLRASVTRVSVRDPWLESSQLDVIVRSGALAGEAEVLELGERERALVWIDGRFAGVRGPGLFALWTVFRRVRVERVTVDSVLFEHAELAAILREARDRIEPILVEPGHVCLLWVDGKLVRKLEAGRYAYWRDAARVQVRPIDLREQVLDVAGQEIMTADKVTLRVNAVLTFRVVDPERAATVAESYEQALYREAQLALRGAVGGRELDGLLADKDGVAGELLEQVALQGLRIGIEVSKLGLRDVILPGDMKVLLNRVTEAKKAAEANLIVRREETAAMRSQANTAKLLESNPTLMRLRELEVLEKVADKANLTVVLGEGGLADRVVKLL
jgi:regulator of protease activity HflC (stomatin/prohibitin superfamily)